MEKLEYRKSKVNGTGLHVTKPFKKGEIIEYIHGPKVLIRHFTPKLSRDTVNWIGASMHTWIDTRKSPFRYINHSCDPNVAIRGERTVYALRDIKAGEEITMDYSLTETEVDWVLNDKCTCGSKNCRGFVGPITALTPKEFAARRHMTPKKFQDVYISFMNKKKRAQKSRA
jgi:hypothetical protein